MQFCDLHIHSNYSDGADTPKEIVSYAKRIGLGAIALTDHNTIDGLADFEKEAREQGIEYALGSELTCEYEGKEIHMLCLFIDLHHTQGIENFTKSIRKIKRARNVELAQGLSADGYEIDFFELEKKYGSNVNRAHFAKELEEKGYVESLDVAFNTLLREGGKYYQGTERPDAIYTIRQIVSWGCVPVMAHPLLSLEGSMLEKFLPLAKEAGLAGFEVYYPKFSPQEMDYLNKLAREYDLISSGGSDYHGEMKKGIVLGMANVPYSAYSKLKFVKNNQKS